jgi:TPR repeat protein
VERELSNTPAAAVPPLDTATLNQLLADNPGAGAAMLLAAARANHPAAQAWLGQLYFDGRGVAADAGEALHWFQRAALAEVPMAMNMLGRCHETAGARRWISGWRLSGIAVPPSANWAGLGWAIYNLAQMQLNGRGMPVDRRAGFDGFTRAVALNHARAMHFLGQFHEYGWEIAVDRALAFELYRRSAEGDDYRGLRSRPRC